MTAPTSLLDRPAMDAEFARIVDELTRRGFLAGAAASALAGLTACGGGASDGPDDDAPTRTVPSVHGPIAVPADPKRVVTTDGFTMAAMFDLGLDPVGVYSAGEEYVEPQFVGKWRSIAKISSGTVGGEINVEKVAALRPDLILGIDAQKPPYDQLAAVAPTVILPFSGAAAPWRDMAEATAATLGRAEALAELDQQYTAKAAQIKNAHGNLLSALRWDVLQGGFDHGQFWVYGPTSPIGGILADAGVRFADASAAVASGHQALSYEEVGALGDADAIFYYTVNSGEPANFGPQLFARPGFAALPAAQAGNLFGTVYFLPSGFSDAIGALDSLEDALVHLSQRS